MHAYTSSLLRDPEPLFGGNVQSITIYNVFEGPEGHDPGMLQTSTLLRGPEPFFQEFRNIIIYDVFEGPGGGMIQA